VPQMRINCDGGYGNRMSAAISGLIAARIGGWTPVIDWVPNDNCAAELSDLYCDIPAEVISTSRPCDWPLITHMEWAGRKCYPHDHESLSVLQGRDVQFTHHYLHWGGKQEAAEVLQGFAIRPEILARVRGFVEDHRIDRSVTGLHVRATDMQYKEQLWHESRLLIEDTTRLFFLCSDEEQVEKELGCHDNVITLPKTHYVEKREPGPWRIPPKDGLAHHCYNVRRTRESVIDAFADLLILSRTDILPNSSSFNLWARIYSRISL
jgi:hypothetical protein